MPTRKQRRREAKEKRHEYEFVYVDSEGHELETPPEEAAAEPKKQDERRNGSSPAAKLKGKQQPQKGSRALRVPQPPSWQRAGKRAALLGVVVFVLFSVMGSKSHSGYLTPAISAVAYTALFIPFTYMIDRYAYRRYLAKQEGGATQKKQPPKKR